MKCTLPPFDVARLTYLKRALETQSLEHASMKSMSVYNPLHDRPDFKALEQLDL